MTQRAPGVGGALSGEPGAVAAARRRAAQRRAAKRRRPSPLVLALSLLGPGLVAANAGNDAGAIATHSSAGANYGYGLLWVMVLISLPLIVVQEQCARMGVVTGKGLADLIRERFGVRWTTFAMATLLVANGGTVVSEFAGIAAALELFGVTRWISVPLVGLGIWLLVTRGNYARVERIFLGMTFAFLAYVIAAFLAGPDWGEVGAALVRPTIQFDRAYLFLFIALIGTTITPYMQLFIQSSVVEKGVTIEQYGLQRAEVVVGSLFANAIVIFVQIATAATLFKAGITVDSASEAAKALEPFVGAFAPQLFGLGLFGASMLAAGVLPLATAFAICDAFGFERGVSRDFDEAPAFYILITLIIVVGVLVTLFAGDNLIVLLLMVQVANGILLPIVLVFVTKLASDRELMGEHVNKPWLNWLAWGTTAIVGSLAVLLITLPAIEAVLGLVNRP